LTASNFGDVVDRIKKEMGSLVHRLLYGKTRRRSDTYRYKRHLSKYTKYGVENEKVAIDIFSQQTGLVVKECGLFVDLEHGFLGASPDGLVGDTAIVEVKCVPSVSDIGLYAAADPKRKGYSNFCLSRDTDGNLKLKEHHKFRRQIQGQLNIVDRDQCYLIVMCHEKKDIHIEVIQRDRDMWLNDMLPRLKAFYQECMLSEIINPRVCRGLSIREPANFIPRPKRRTNRNTWK
jgi:hypothetical protein